MSSRPAPGRRPDSLFDNRYRIEQSLPRGRSGETLRAADLQDGERPVIIKRPALQDAPPMRAGQEQVILNEMNALERLAGLPGVIALRNTGNFRVAGQNHQYIVLDVAPGESLELLAQRLESCGERLPDLEMLVTFDKLLDTLQSAHERSVVHNNLNVQNVFWSQADYCLTVLSWGDAILLDADSPADAVSPDLLPVGEVMRFVATGGHPERLSNDADIWPRLKTILARAADPDQHYLSLAALRQELTDLRRPLEQDRDNLLGKIRDALPQATAAEHLEELRGMIQRAVNADPGYPPVHELITDIDERLARFQFQDNLHAIYVYMTSGNMGRAMGVLGDLEPNVDAGLEPIMAFLMDACKMMQEQPIMPLSAGLSDALNALLNGDTQAAGRYLVMSPETRPVARQQQNTLALWLTERIPGVVLLRPHLLRLDDTLTGPAHDQLRVIIARLEKPLPRGVQALKGLYEQTASGLQALNLSQVPGVEQARQAAETIVTYLDSALQTTLSDPAHAAEMVNRARSIDPANPSFDSFERMLNVFHTELDGLQSFGPAEDGIDIAQFLVDARTRLQPYLTDITDPQFQAMLRGIDEASAAWARVGEAIVMGGRRPALTACQQAADAVRPLSPAIARWFDAYLQQIQESQHVEHLSPNPALGAVLETGWELWDRGRGADAKAAGEQALTACTTDGERHAAQRLIDLSEVMTGWLSNDGPMNPRRTEQAESRVLTLMLPEEEVIQRTFSKQMPDAAIYLKAMARGLVEPMRETSAAGVRALFLYYVLRGMLDLQDENPDKAVFWRDAALKCLTTARMHPAFQALDAAILRRQLIGEAASAINAVKHISDLPAARQAARAPLAASQLEATNQAIRAVDEALHHWSQGDFRGARQLIDSAAERIAFAEATLGKDFGPFKAWLQDLGASAEIAQGARRAVEQIALVPVDTPDSAVMDHFQKMIEITRRDIGEKHTQTARQWRDTYAAIRDIYQDEKLDRAEKVRLLDGYFVDEALDQNPSLSILRHWYNQVKRLPEPPQREAPARAPAYAQILAAQAADDPDNPADPRSPARAEMRRPAAPVNSANLPRPVIRSQRISPAMLTMGLLVLVVMATIFAVLVLRANEPPLVQFTLAPTLGGPIAGVSTLAPTVSIEPTTAEPSATSTDMPTSTPPTLPPTITPVVPTPTAPSPPPPTNTLDPNISPTPTVRLPLAPGGTPAPEGTLQPPTFAPTAQGGDYDLLQNLSTLSKPTWDKTFFSNAGTYWQLGTPTLRTNGPTIVVRLGPDVMTPLFGVDAATKVTRLDANLQLDSYDKSLLPTGNVRFGIGLESVNGPRIAVQANLVQANVVDLGLNQNGTFVRKTEVPVNNVTIAVTIQRNPDNTLSLYEEGQLLGTSGPSFGPTTPVRIYMYTSAGGVVVKVTSLKIHLE